VTWEEAYFNSIRPHKGLRVEIPDDFQLKWTPQTPSMAVNLTDHIWTVKELLLNVSLPSA